MATFAAATIVLGAAAGTGVGAPRSSPAWQDVPRGSRDDQHVAWVGNRVWFYRGPVGGAISVKSARVAGGRLTGWVFATRAGAAGYSFKALLGQDLVYATPGSDLKALRLLPNGQLGAPREMAGAPPPASSAGARVARLRDRAVQLVTAGQGPYHIAVCCDTAGNTVAYPWSTFRYPDLLGESYLGVDRHGRLWLTWWMGIGYGAPSPAKIVQLDPRTLKARSTPATIPIPGLRHNQVLAFTCADTCRMVVVATQKRGPGGVFAWAPGERSPTLLNAPMPGRAPYTGNYLGLLDAASFSGGLAITYEWFVNPGSNTVALARGDARGNHLRIVSSIVFPFKGAALLRPIGAFGPGGWVVVGIYGSHTVRAAILPAA